MKRYAIALTRSLNDLEVIYDRIAAQHPRNAARFIEKIKHSIAKLGTAGDSLELSLEGRELNTRSHHLNVKPYRVLYRIDADAVVVLQVRHGARRGAGRDEHD